MKTYSQQVNDLASQMKELATDPQANRELWTLLRVATASCHLMTGKLIGDALIGAFERNPNFDKISLEYVREFESNRDGHYSMNVWPMDDVEGRDGSHEIEVEPLLSEMEGEEHDIFCALNASGQNAPTPESVKLFVDRKTVETHKPLGGLAVFAAVAPEAYAKHMEEASERVVEKCRHSDRPA